MKNLSRFLALGVGGAFVTIPIVHAAHNVPDSPRGSNPMRELTAFSLRVTGDFFLISGALLTTIGKGFYSLAKTVRKKD